MEVSPEQIGLCGCRQIVAVRRERIESGSQTDEPSDEIGYYVTSRTLDECTEKDLHEAIRGHWSAIENGVHHRRDVSFGEDDCRIANRRASHAMATLRNLAIGLFELQLARGRLRTENCKSWRRQMTFTNALKLLSS